MTPEEALEVKRFEQSDASLWNAYVLAHPDGTVFHKLAWSHAVEEAYGHQPLHLVAWSQGRICGVLPLFLVKSLLVGRVLPIRPVPRPGRRMGALADHRRGGTRAALHR